MTKHLYLPVTEELVNRFLMWPVPADVYPDGTPGLPGRTGTNLLSAPQAQKMLEHVLQPVQVPTQVNQDVAELLRLASLIDLRFQSMNSVPVEKAVVPANEWHRLMTMINQLAQSA